MPTIEPTIVIPFNTVSKIGSLTSLSAGSATKGMRQPACQQLRVGRGQDASPQRLLEQAAGFAQRGSVRGRQQRPAVGLERGARMSRRHQALHLHPVPVDCHAKAVGLSVEHAVAQVRAEAVYLRPDRHRLAPLAVQRKRELLSAQTLRVHR